MKLLYIPLLILLLSCSKKNSNFTLKGTITDTSLSGMLSGATIDLYKQVSGTSYETFIASTTTDPNGNYSFIFSRDRSDKYIIKISKTNYFSSDENITSGSLSIEKDNVRNFSMIAKSWVKLHFKNIDPLPEDVLRYMKQQGKVDCTECCPSDYQYLNGSKDTSIYCINDGNTTYSYLYSVIGTSNTAIKSVITIPFDTTEIYLEY